MKLSRLALLATFSSTSAFALYGPSPANPGQVYVGLGGSSTTLKTKEFQYGTRNNGTVLMSFKTETSALSPELTLGHVIKQQTLSSWTNFRIESSMAYAKKSVEDSIVGSAVITPPINGQYGVNWPTNYESNNTLKTEDKLIDLDVMVKSDINTNRWGLVLTPAVGMTFIRFSQDFKFKSTPLTSGGTVGNVEVNEKLSTNYYGAKGSLILTERFNELFSLSFGAGTSILQANASLSANQKVESSNTSLSRDVTFDKSRTDFAMRSFASAQFGLHTSYGVLSVYGRYDSFSYVPYVQNPQSYVIGQLSQASIEPDKMTSTAIGLTYSYAFL